MSSPFSKRSSREQPPLLLLKLLLLSYATATIALASPVSSPEINAKSGKSNQASNIIANTQSNSLQQQQHQQQYSKLNSQEPHLNSLNVFASNYDSISSNNNHNNHNNNNNQNNNNHNNYNTHQKATNSNFKPSFSLNGYNNNNKLPATPEFETNFTPIQSSAIVNLPTDPVVMQYMPQTIQEGGVQYLQLIPTHPLIVPISSYVPNGAQAHVSADVATGNLSPYQQTSPALTSNIIADYTPHTPAMLSSIPLNVAPPPPASLMEVPAALTPYGIQTYAPSLQPYRNSYRINREIKPNNIPSSLNLNMHEYLPSPNDGAKNTNYVRGRP